MSIVFGEASYRKWTSMLIEQKRARILGSLLRCAVEGFGSVIAPAGDVNGDGLTDIVIGDPKFTSVLGEVRGRICLIYGSRTPSPVIHTDDLAGQGMIVENYRLFRGSELAMAVFGGADLDGNGFAEFGLSLQEDSGLGGSQGRVLIVRGGAQLPALLSFLEIENGSRGFEVKPSNPQEFGRRS